VRMILDQFNADVEGLKFFIKKKNGIKYKDYGTVDIYLRESSLLLELHVKLLEDEVDYIELSKVETNLHGLKLKISEAKHDIIDKMVVSIFLPTIRFKLQNMINNALYDNVNKGLFDRVNNSLKKLHYHKKTKKLSTYLEKEGIPTGVSVEKEELHKTSKADEIEIKEEKTKKSKKVDVEINKEEIPKAKKVKRSSEHHDKKGVEFEKETFQIPTKVKEEKTKKSKEVDVEIKKEEIPKATNEKRSSEHRDKKSTKTTETEVLVDETTEIVPQDLKEAEADYMITERIPDTDKKETKVEVKKEKKEGHHHHHHDKEKKTEVKYSKDEGKGEKEYTIEASLKK